ncbi:MAG: alpha/beta hydrolase [Oscillospiraceae bacterium]|jgi:fermentation-respiration switch protein FrsA (DUF1100 family)|nr:alpha/beta hydrolase [Oscillospiraceae bacterium]
MREEKKLEKAKKESSSRRLLDSVGSSSSLAKRVKKECEWWIAWKKRNEPLPSFDEQITSFDGLELVGSSFVQPEAVPKWVIVVPGFTGNRLKMLDYVQIFYKHGFNVLLVYCRGRGKSEGENVTMGWLDRLDLVAWANKLVKDSPDARIVLFGLSMGGATVMMAAGENLPPNVKCAIEDCGYSSVWDLFSRQLGDRLGLSPGLVRVAADAFSRSCGGLDLKKASAVDQLRKARIPVMFIHGGQDNIVLTDMVHDCFEVAPTEKELYIVPGAGHGQALLADPAEYVKRLFEFINKYV